MPTISKISMIGYAPIANRKLNQKASNPISANNSDSRDLMSPNAHYGRYAVSFKARITPQQAEAFLNRSFGEDVQIHVSEAKQRVKDLLSIIAEPEFTHLKGRALGHLSDLSGHENPDVRLNTLIGIKESINQNHAFVTPEILNRVIIPHLNNNDEVDAALQAAGECFRHIKPESASQLPPIDPKHIISCLDDKDSTDISLRLNDIDTIAKLDFGIATPELYKKVKSLMDKRKPESDPVNKAASSLLRTLLAPREILEMRKIATISKHPLPNDSINNIASFLHLDGSCMSEDQRLILARHKPQKGLMQSACDFFKNEPKEPKEPRGKFFSYELNN